MGVELLIKYFPDLNPWQVESFSRLKTLYEAWNRRINVISRRDIDFIYEKHVLHSLSIAKIISFNDEANILDVGTGGGFPGVPLAILFPQAKFHLIDSIAKKIKVVTAVCSELELDNVSAEQVRAEDVHTKYDFVISRAVTQMGPFLQWVKGNFIDHSSHSLPNGILALKGGDLQEEMKEIKRNYRIFEIGDFFQEEFFRTKKIVYIPMTNR